MEELQELLRKARAAIRDGVPIEQVNAALASRTGGAVESYLQLTDTVTRQLNPDTDRGEPIGRVRAGLQHFGQGVTLGLGDELSGVAGGVRSAIGGGGFRQGYDEGVAESRAMLAQGKEEHPVVSGAAEMAGLVAPAAAIGGPSTLLGRAALGAGEAAAFGAANADPSPEKDLPQSLFDRAIGGGAAAPLGLLGAGAYGIGSRAIRLGRALTPAGRAARRPFGQGLEAADDVLQTTGAGGRSPAMRSPQAAEAFEAGKRLFTRPPEEIAEAVHGATFQRQAIRDGLSEAMGDRLRRIGDPDKVVHTMASPAFRNRLRVLFDDPEDFNTFMEVVDRAVKLQDDAALAKAGGEIARNAIVFGLGAGLSSAMAQVF